LQRNPDARIRSEISKLRHQASERGLTDAVSQIDKIEQALNPGYIVRAGGPAEPRRAQPHPLWRKPPPENP
jgi:hypothetical protein